MTYRDKEILARALRGEASKSIAEVLRIEEVEVVKVLAEHETEAEKSL